MRKIVLFIAALLFMAVPVMAASTVHIYCSDDDINCVTISYLSDTNLIRAFALDINVGPEDCNIKKIDTLDPDYRIYPGQIDIANGKVSDYGTPYATADLNDANLTIEMGSLYTMDANYASDPNLGYNKKPTLSGTLLKFYVYRAGHAIADCNYKIDVNVMRGGIVMEDPYETPNVILCAVGHIGAAACTVPNVVNMTQADANAAIIAAGYIVGNITVSATCGAAGDFNIVSTNPAAGQTPACGTAVDTVRCECYAGQGNYAQWEAAGKPVCWCYPRQCHGDADGKVHGTGGMGGYWWVGQPDVDILSAGWMVKDPPKGPGILNQFVNGVPVACADFDHQLHGTGGMGGYWRIGQPDVDILSLYWMVKEPPKGTGTPTGCVPGNRNP